MNQTSNGPTELFNLGMAISLGKGMSRIPITKPDYGIRLSIFLAIKFKPSVSATTFSYKSIGNRAIFIYTNKIVFYELANAISALMCLYFNTRDSLKVKSPFYFSR